MIRKKGVILVTLSTIGCLLAGCGLLLGILFYVYMKDQIDTFGDEAYGYIDGYPEQ